MPQAAKIEEFFGSLQSVSKLVGDLALNIAEAQSRLDEDYMRSLGDFGTVLKEKVQPADLKADEFVALFKSLAPSRYQFTETVVEVRADLQMTSAKQVGGSVELGYKTPVLAATLNASYVKRSAYDYQASALIRTVLHAVPPDLGVMKALLDRLAAADKLKPLEKGSRFESFASALDRLLPAPKAS